VYNRLHSRDEMLTCPSCGRMLYIPEDLPPEVAVNKAKEVKEPRAKKEKAPKSGPSVGAAINRQSSAEDVVNSVTIEEDTPEPAQTGGEGAEASNDTPASGQS